MIVKKALLFGLTIILLFVGLSCKNGDDSNGIIPPDELFDKTYVTPSTVEISNYFAGGRAEYEISIHNGKDKPADFSVSYLVPSAPKEGYSLPSDQVINWITISQPILTIPAKGTTTVLIILEMPKNAHAPADKWEFHVAVKDISQEGIIQTQLAIRWLVDMG